MDRLAQEPRSLWRAKAIVEYPSAASSEPDPVAEWLGWGRVENMLADLIDAVRLNTEVTAAHGSGKPAKLRNPYPRPGTVTRPKNLAEVNRMIGI